MHAIAGLHSQLVVGQLLSSFLLLRCHFVAVGMMPIPYAFNLLGWSLGSAMLVGVALVSYWTMAVMVQVRVTGGLGRGGGDCLVC